MYNGDIAVSPVKERIGFVTIDSTSMAGETVFTTSKEQRDKERQSIKALCPLVPLSLGGKAFAQFVPVQSIACLIGERFLPEKKEFVLISEIRGKN